jgi:hypothetical protein
MLSCAVQAELTECEVDASWGVTSGFTGDFFIGSGFCGLNSVRDPCLICFSVTLIWVDFAVRTTH